MVPFVHYRTLCGASCGRCLGQTCERKKRKRGLLQARDHLKYDKESRRRTLLWRTRPTGRIRPDQIRSMPAAKARVCTRGGRRRIPTIVRGTQGEEDQVTGWVECAWQAYWHQVYHHAVMQWDYVSGAIYDEMHRFRDARTLIC